MSHPSVVVLSYGSGNVRSAVRALERVGADVELTADPDAVGAADGLVVPGVGAFGAVMDQLRSAHAPRLIDRRLAGGRPVLGICVGMQVMFDSSPERCEPLGEHREGRDARDGTRRAGGLGQWPGTVSRLRAGVVPHMGWSEVRAPRDTVLFDGVAGERFYFVHSYAAHTAPDGALTSWVEHDGDRCVAAVERGPVCSTQFHPEKSGRAGARLLRNWLDIVEGP